MGGDANENGLVVLPLVDDEHAVALQEAYGQCLADDQSTRAERKQRLPVIHVGIETGGGARLPVEMIDVISEVQPTGWWALFGIVSNRQGSQAGHTLTSRELSATSTNCQNCSVMSRSSDPSRARAEHQSDDDGL